MVELHILSTELNQSSLCLQISPTKQALTGPAVTEKLAIMHLVLSIHDIIFTFTDSMTSKWPMKSCNIMQQFKS